jgi:hypothetical protein
VEQQQNLRYPGTKPRGEPDANEPAHETTEHHEELDELFDNLDLGDSAPRVPLRDLLLGSDEETLHKLEDVVAERLEEGFGETVFELGFEHNGDSMNLQLDEWNRAYDRLIEATKKVQGSSQLLITHNVGGDKELATAQPKSSTAKGCNGKVLLRKIPSRIEDVIETRIAVVGNGTCRHRPSHQQRS